MIFPSVMSFHVRCPMTKGAEPKDFGTCIGNRCAAWRYTEHLRQRAILAPDVCAKDEPTRPAGVPASWQWRPFTGTDDDPASWVQPVDEAHGERYGYCGLAGPVRDET